MPWSCPRHAGPTRFGKAVPVGPLPLSEKKSARREAPDSRQKKALRLRTRRIARNRLAGDRPLWTTPVRDQALPAAGETDRSRGRHESQGHRLVGCKAREGKRNRRRKKEGATVWILRSSKEKSASRKVSESREQKGLTAARSPGNNRSAVRGNGEQQNSP